MTPEGAVPPASLWHTVTPPGPELPALAGDERCDAVVIGAGFTGLSAALHLAEAGIGTVVLEAAEPGFGASGRNNGQVIPTLSRADPDAIIAKHGPPANASSRSCGIRRLSCSISRAATPSMPKPSRPAGFSPPTARAGSGFRKPASGSGRDGARRSRFSTAARSGP